MRPASASSAARSRSTVAHDAHNIVLIGALGAAPTWRPPSVGWPSSVAGRWRCSTGEVVAEVALPLAGLMSDRPAAEVAAALESWAGPPRNGSA